MAKYIDQELFNMCAVTALKIGCASGQSVASASQLIAKEYSRSYQDKSLAEEIEDAANKIAEFLSHALPNSSIASACTQMQYCIKHFNLDGSKKRKKILGGVWFTGETKELDNKVDTCAVNIITYHMLVIGGTIPVAPRGWNL